MSYPLSGFAASPKGDDSFAARRRLLAASEWGVLCVGFARGGGCNAVY